MYVNIGQRWKVFERCHQGVARGEGMEGNLKGNYLRLIPGLCLEERMNS